MSFALELRLAARRHRRNALAEIGGLEVRVLFGAFACNGNADLLYQVPRSVARVDCTAMGAEIAISRASLPASART